MRQRPRASSAEQEGEQEGAPPRVHATEAPCGKNTGEGGSAGGSNGGGSNGGGSNGGANDIGCDDGGGNDQAPGTANAYVVAKG